MLNLPKRTAFSHTDHTRHFARTSRGRSVLSPRWAEQHAQVVGYGKFYLRHKASEGESSMGAIVQGTLTFCSPEVRTAVSIVAIDGFR